MIFHSKYFGLALAIGPCADAGKSMVSLITFYMSAPGFEPRTLFTKAEMNLLCTIALHNLNIMN